MLTEHQGFSHYRLSTDYNRLFDILLEGKSLVGFAHYRRDPDFMDVVEIARRAPCEISIYCRGRTYGYVLPYMCKERSEQDVFLAVCEMAMLKWIEPCASLGAPTTRA